MKNPLIRLLTLTSLYYLAACSGSADSEDVRTPGVRAEIEISAHGNGSTNVVVDLEVGDEGFFSATDLKLTGSDALTASSNTETKTLTREHDILGNITYETTFSSAAPGTQFVVSFQRTGDSSAPNSSVSLPEAFSITAPSDDEIFGVNENIVITWNASTSADKFQVVTSSTCPIPGGSSFSGTILTTEDDGSFTLTAEDALGLVSDETPPDSVCEVDLTLLRINNGSLDPNYGEGGYIEGVQQRSLTLNILL